MKKLVYKNIISIIVFFLLPWFYLENRDTINNLTLLNDLLYAVVFVGVIYLFYENTKFIKNARGKKIIVPSIFLLFPLFVIFLFLYSKFFLFFNYKGL